MTSPHPASTPSARRGLLAGGNWVVDHIKLIDTWPEQDALASVLSHSTGSGGAPYNVLKALARLGAPFPLEALGLVGDDADGAAILEDCRTEGIVTTQLRPTSAASTSCTDVMTVQGTGRRTFFYNRGANAHLDVEHFDFGLTQARHFHLGYLLLLDRLDRLVDGVPAVNVVLRKARLAGLTTSVDCVSDSHDRFASLVKPVLPEVDVFFANDYEASRIVGASLGPRGSIDRRATEEAAATFFRAGVRNWVVIHFAEGCLACSRSGESFWQPCVALNPGEIINAAGAGDALATGVLYGWHEGWTLAEALRLGAAAAACSLRHLTCTEGILPLAETLAFAERRGYRPLPFL